MEGTLGPLRLVMLDGTFPGAAKEARYLIQCLQLRGVPAPVVKLDLESGVCKSAVAGLMYQPREDTICTFQAIVMALQQAGCGAAFCHSLTQHLQDWITHLLVHCVKQGKSREKRCNKGIVDTTPTDFLIKAIKTRDELRVARVTEKHTLWLERLSMQELARATRLFALTHTKKFSVADFLYT
ncbi:hypothetical protein B484DRAFT_407348 [Ochromonadaceae sp. CCMP2298]|nr:hypothetical protein B484DRAFT_407348 [Ochromonadaceae sp. CCMP2298]